MFIVIFLLILAFDINILKAKQLQRTTFWSYIASARIVIALVGPFIVHTIVNGKLKSTVEGLPTEEITRLSNQYDGYIFASLIVLFIAVVVIHFVATYFVEKNEDRGVNLLIKICTNCMVVFGFLSFYYALGTLNKAFDLSKYILTLYLLQNGWLYIPVLLRVKIMNRGPRVIKSSKKKTIKRPIPGQENQEK